MDALSATGTVGKAMRILDFLAGAGHPQRMSEIARRTQLPKPTVHRLLAVLLAEGAVSRNGTCYLLAEHDHPLVSLVHDKRGAQLRRALTPHLLMLHQQMGHMVSLGVLRGFTVDYLETLYAQPYADIIWRTAQRAPAHCTAAGKLMLAYSFEAEARVTRAELRSFTPHTIAEPNRLLDELAAISASGVAFAHQEYVSGYTAVAAPVFGHPGSVAASISIGGPVGKIDIVAAERLIRSVALTASTALRGAAALARAAS
jgi:DNA-binding IclR family transcriptional regulator